VYTRTAGESGSPQRAMPRHNFPQFVPVNELPIGVLHLGVKTALLEQAGFRSVGDLANVTRDQIIRIPKVGWRTANLLAENRQAILKASAADTGVD